MFALILWGVLGCLLFGSGFFLSLVLCFDRYASGYAFDFALIVGVMLRDVLIWWTFRWRFCEIFAQCCVGPDCGFWVAFVGFCGVVRAGLLCCGMWLWLVDLVYSY